MIDRSKQQPPEEDDQFESVPSAVEGVTLFRYKMPSSKEKPVEDVVEFHCPDCDAPVFFVTEEGLVCDHCGYREEVEEVKDIKHDGFKRPLTPKTLKQLGHGWGTVRRTIHCNRCHAESSVPKTAVAYTCPYCLSNQVHLTNQENDVLRPNFIKPFKLSKEEAVKRFIKRIRELPYVPKSVLVRKKISVMQMYAPVWYISMQSEFTETFSGDREIGKKAHFFIGANQKMPIVPNQKMNKYHLEELEPFNPDYVAGMPVLLPDVDLEAGWRQARKEVRQQFVKKAKVTKISFRETAVTYDDESWDFVLVPIYVLRYQFKGENYYFLVDGADGQSVGEVAIDETAVVWDKVTQFVPAIMTLILIALHQFLIYTSSNYLNSDRLFHSTTIWGMVGVGLTAFFTYTFQNPKISSAFITTCLFVSIIFFLILNPSWVPVVVGSMFILLINFGISRGAKIDERVVNLRKMSRNL